MRFLPTTALAQEDRQAVLARELPKLTADYAAADIRALGPETPLSRTYYDLLLRYVPYARNDLHDWPPEPGAKFHKRDGSLELAVRQNATVALALATLSRYGQFDERLAGTSRAQLRADAVALLTYLCVTHRANFRPTGDGNPWGDHWQSAHWAALAGQAAWLLWDQLPAPTRVMATRMIIHEANRFNTRPSDDGEWSDTKAEENAWNSQAIAPAACMFPQHPNAALWRERAIVWMLNSFTTKADHADSSLIDGRPVKDRVTTTCIHDDYTLENHDRVHPDYFSTFTLNLRNALLYQMAGMNIPASTFHHVKECCAVLAQLTAANGTLFYINGQDWWPHRVDVPLLAGGLTSVLLRDPQSAYVERAALATLQKLHARFADGRAFDSREYNYPNLEEEMMARYAELYLAHRLFGEGPKAATQKAFLKAQSGTRVFEVGGFVTHRTPDTFASFAWVNGAMGLVYASDDTWFTSPYERSLVGRISLAGVKDTPPKLETRNVQRLLGPNETGEGFAFTGRFARCEGKVGQTLAMISLPDGPVLYLEQLRARADLDVKEVASGVLAILNENAPPLAHNKRSVWTLAGTHVLRGDSNEPARVTVWQTPWANIDDRLSVVLPAQGTMAWVETHQYQQARLQQQLIANYLPNLGPRKSGQIISEAVLGILPNARHTRHPDLRVVRLGENATAVRFGAWLVAVNLGDQPVSAQAFGQTLSLGPVAATILPK